MSVTLQITKSNVAVLVLSRPEKTSTYIMVRLSYAQTGSP
jgi:hypothetical protein